MVGITRLAATALAAGTLSVVGLSLGVGAAQADTKGPFQWCPGQSLDAVGKWGGAPVWNMNVCHTYWKTYSNIGGNVPVRDGLATNIWEGDEPPPGPTGPTCALFICIPG